MTHARHAASDAASDVSARQRWRLLAQAGFFVLFCLAPVFDLLRYDLVAGHAWLLGQEWHAGLETFARHELSTGQFALHLLAYVFAPILGTGLILLTVAWRWGRLYCGWLCPHFSVVETINRLMWRACGRFSLWEVPVTQYDLHTGQPLPTDPRWWLITLPLTIGFAFVWAVVLLTYLLPPFEIYHNLFAGTLTRNQLIFISAGTVVLSLEFLFARHLFCRYACAVGLFQSLAWVLNRKAMVVGFDRPRASQCSDCHSTACEQVCPMRLKPRSIKRKMFTCTQCSQCLDACATTQQHNPQGSLLRWVRDEAARQNEAGLQAGNNPAKPKG
jgi:polyferredoxin